MANSETQFQDLTDTAKEYIFSRCLNFTDLKNARLVCQNWNNIISTTDALRNGIFCVSVEKQNRLAIQITQVYWKNIRLNIFDIEYDIGTIFTQPIPLAFKYITTLEFRQSFISWTTFEKHVIISPLLQNIKFYRCIFKSHPLPHPSSAPPIMEEMDETFLKRMKEITVLTIADVTEVSGMIEIMEKMIKFGVCKLETLKIEYHQAGVDLVSRDIIHFLQVLGEIIILNKDTLRNLILNIRSTHILNFFGPLVLSRLENLEAPLQLQVFKLAQPLPDTNNILITLETGRFLIHFGDFLRTQRNLRNLAFPHLENLRDFEARRWYILDHTTKKLQKLRVPGGMYLRRNFLKSFHNLKFLFIGEKTLGGAASFIHPTKFNVDRGRDLGKMRDLEVFAKVVYESGSLYHIVEKFPFLTKFEVNCFRPLFNDKDMQAIIKHVPFLTHISIANCDYITDFGITGIPLETCVDMIRYSTLYIDDIKTKKKLAVTGSPISNLKQLTNLVLNGNGKISDVGIKFGIEILDLRKLHLPYGKRITEWGINQLGQQNPCLESLILTGATAETAVGLTQLIATHKRLIKRHCKVQNIKSPDIEFLPPTLLHGILWNWSHN